MDCPIESGLHRYRFSHFRELLDLVEVHVAIHIGGLGIHRLDAFHVLGDGRNLAHHRADRGQFGGAEGHKGIDAKTVVEID